MASQTLKKPTFDGHEIANTLYGDRPKKRTIEKHLGRGMFTTIETEPNRRKKRRRKIEKVKLPDHWSKDFQPNHKHHDHKKPTPE